MVNQIVTFDDETWRNCVFEFSQRSPVNVAPPLDFLLPYICMNANIDPLIKIAFSVANRWGKVGYSRNIYASGCLYDSSCLLHHLKCLLLKTISNLKFVLFMVENFVTRHILPMKSPNIRISSHFISPNSLALSLFLSVFVCVGQREGESEKRNR